MIVEKDKSSNAPNEWMKNESINQNDDNLEISSTGYGYQSVPKKSGQLKSPRI
jgi:hypothetical protein